MGIIRRALTRKRVARGRVVEEEPSDRLVWAVKFSLGITGILVALEAVHLVVLGYWNSEIFSAITGLIGTVSGVLLGRA